MLEDFRLPWAPSCRFANKAMIVRLWESWLGLGMTLAAYLDTKYFYDHEFLLDIFVIIS